MTCLHQKLLEDNQALNEKYDMALQQHTQAIDSLEQECHRLRHALKTDAGEKVCFASPSSPRFSPLLPLLTLLASCCQISLRLLSISADLCFLCSFCCCALAPFLRLFCLTVGLSYFVG